MHEEYYGFVEKPFSLTPDPKYLYKSESHASAFELLQFVLQGGVHAWRGLRTQQCHRRSESDGGQRERQQRTSKTRAHDSDERGGISQRTGRAAPAHRRRRPQT